MIDVFGVFFCIFRFETDFHGKYFYSSHKNKKNKKSGVETRFL